MKTRIRFVTVVVIVALAASPSVGYIHFPPVTMPKMCKDSSNIRVLTVKKHDKEKGVIVYEVAETLKGENSKITSFRHALRPDFDGVKPVYDWVKDGKKAVMFTIEGKDLACGFVFIDEFCYSVDYNVKGEFWFLIRVDPELAATYYGSVEQLQKVAKDLLAGKDVKVPVKDEMKPLTIKEREKIFNSVNDLLKQNRGFK